MNDEVTVTLTRSELTTLIHDCGNSVSDSRRKAQNARKAKQRGHSAVEYVEAAARSEILFGRLVEIARNNFPDMLPTVETPEAWKGRSGNCSA